MATKSTTAGQYWDEIPKGARARTELAQEHFTEFSAFTGSDIKAFILPQGDQVARNEIIRRLNNVEELLLDNPNGLDIAQINGELIATEQERVTSKAGIADPRDYIPLVNLQSITISTFRSKTQVRALGHVNVRGLARGSRTVAGTFILTEFNKDAFWDILTAPYRDLNIGDSGPILPDQMRPFDILLLFAHEMGNIAIRHIYGLEIVTNGVVYSIQDYYNENTLSYLAHDVSPLIPLGPAFVNDVFSDLSGARIKLSRLIESVRGTTLDTEYEYLKKARNPFR